MVPLQDIFETKFDLDFDLPVVFIDTHFNRSNAEEAAAYVRQTEELWKVSLNRRPFECLTRNQVQENLRREKQDLASMRRACRDSMQLTSFPKSLDLFPLEISLG